MGCDIHAFKERRAFSEDGRPWGWWIQKGDPEIRRDYELFSVLANVRNYDNKPFISEPKGLPSDLSAEAEVYFENESTHSNSWLTLEELKNFDTEQEFDDISLILKKEGEKIVETRLGTTGEHLGPVGRRKIFGLWGKDQWFDLINQLEQLKTPHHSDKDVRIVFGFDN